MRLLSAVARTTAGSVRSLVKEIVERHLGLDIVPLNIPRSSMWCHQRHKDGASPFLSLYLGYWHS